MCLGSDCPFENMDRRDFLAGSAAAFTGLAVSGVASAADQKQPPPTRVLDNTSIRHGKVTFKSGDKEIDGYLAQPKTQGKHPAVLVVAGNVITEEYIPNTCAALALAGYVGLAPNIFHLVRPGMSPAEMNKTLANWTDANYLADIQSGSDFLKTHPDVNAGAMGILGFCSGGRRALLQAARSSDIKTVVAFHIAAHTKPAEVDGLKAPVQLHHGKADKVSPYTVSLEIEKKLRAQSTPVEVFLYDNADHGFLAYTRHPEYNPTAAQEAWKRTVTFLDSHLKK